MDEEQKTEIRRRLIAMVETVIGLDMLKDDIMPTITATMEVGKARTRVLMTVGLRFPLEDDEDDE